MRQRGRIPGKVKDPRRCNICHKEKPLTEFSPAPSKPGGRVYNCRACDRQKQLERSTRNYFKSISSQEAKKIVQEARNIYQCKLNIYNELFVPGGPPKEF